MNPTDTIIALEKALEYVKAEHGRVAVSIDSRLDLLRGRRDANENFSAVCSPLAIRTLLDAHASALRDAARLDWLVARMSDRDFREIGLSYRCGDKSIRPAIDAQMAALDDNTKGAAE